MGKNTGKNTADNLIPWKKGDPSPNPNGRPKGRKNFSTLYREAIEKIAATTGDTPDEFELKIVMQALRKAHNGDIAFYRDTMDRLHGKAPQPLSNADGQPLIVSFDASFKK